MQYSDIFEWQREIWGVLLEYSDRLPHALLLIGREGVGKGVFAEALAARLLCETAQGKEGACGRCTGCQLLASGNHPDFRKVTLEEEDVEDTSDVTSTKKAKSEKKTSPRSSQIKIHQIRSLEDFVYVGSHRQGRRLVIIDPADAMNVAATNALLKILEEPPEYVCFLLISSNERRLLPTLRSRCRQISFPMPAADTASRWLATQKIAKADRLLALASGSPLKALELGRDGVADIIDEAIAPLMQQGVDPLMVAAHWDGLRRKYAGFNLETLVDSMQKWVYDLMRVKRTGGARYFIDRDKDLTAIAARSSELRLQRCYADLLKIRAVARHPLNELLLLEDMATRCLAGFAQTGRAS